MSYIKRYLAPISSIEAVNSLMSTIIRVCDIDSKLCKLFIVMLIDFTKRAQLKKTMRFFATSCQKTYFTNLDQGMCYCIADHSDSYYRKIIYKTPINIFIALYSKKVADKLVIIKKSIQRM